MKIGEFARKHNVTIDTVRHYISQGLLTPLRVNTQYVFSEIDDRVMESILLLKSMNFKLEEMKAYLLFQTIYTNHSFSNMGSFRERFEQKREENLQQIAELERMNQMIALHLAEEKDCAYHRGVPVSMLTDLACAGCKSELELSATQIAHNEIMEGELICPMCGKVYHIHEGILSDQPDMTIAKREEVAEVLEQYIAKNDEHYIQKLRELFQKASEIVSENSHNAKNILIDGDSAEFLDSSIFRAVPKDAKVFVHVNQNLVLKEYMEDIFPKKTILFAGELENCPFCASMDYIFLQDYDYNMLNKQTLSLYKSAERGAIVDCFKVLEHRGKTAVEREADFLLGMKKHDLQMEKVYRSGEIINKKESCDMSILQKDEDLTIEYGIYTFKTLG